MNRLPATDPEHRRACIYSFSLQQSGGESIQYLRV
jgi:hypothetical protein